MSLMRFGCKPSMWASPIALAIGVTMGYVFCFYHLYASFHSYPFTTSSFFQVNSSNCKSDERINMVNANMMRVFQKSAQWKEEVKELNEKLRELPMAGPFGTVKGSRTNPPVVPDESVNPRLAKILEEVAIAKELIVVLANSNVQDKLELQVSTVKKVGILNYLIVALDNDIATFCKSNDIAVYKSDLDDEEAAIGKMAAGDKVSGLKFRILREFLQLGYSVLLSDVDIIYLQNPFEHLYRDSDVESMTDGHDNKTAYGYQDIFDDPIMGWSRHVHTNRIWVYNSGFFYIRPTIPAIEVLDRVTDRLSKEEHAWDQVVFNEVLFYPSRLGYEGVYASKRTMDFYSFMNSKVLFMTVRKDPNLKKFKPVIIHINYHPDKLPRMKAVIEYYVDGKMDALDSFPDGTVIESRDV